MIEALLASVIIGLAVAIVVFLIYANMQYRKVIKDMTPDERTNKVCATRATGSAAPVANDRERG